MVQVAASFLTVRSLTVNAALGRASVTTARTLSRRIAPS
jgi:hypothetical protein